MNYLFLNSAGVWGGNEKWTHMAANSLAQYNTVHIAYKNEVVGSRYALDKLRLPFRFSYDPLTIVPLISFVRNNNIDILIPTKKRDYVIAGIVAHRCGKRNILRLGIVRNLGRNPYKNLVYNKLADGIIVNAGKIKSVLLQSPFMSKDKIKVIYNGIDIESIDAQSVNEPSPVKPFPFMICTVGRISKRKGLHDIIILFADFLKQTQSGDAGLVIIGSGDRTDEYKSLASNLGIAPRVRFTGYLDNPYPYLRMNDVYVTLSRNEGLSNALLEAMYLENAVITSKAGGTDEIIIDRYNGLLVDDHAHDKGAKLLVELYNDASLRRSLGKAARTTVIEKCSIENMTSEIHRFCEAVVNKPK
jgi:glycosyltransferase involved in cell wall biosynthesis